MSHMLHLLGSIPKKVTVACSGGPDSMAALDFCHNGHREVTVAYFNHKTPHSHEALAFLQKYCEKKNFELLVGEVSGDRPPRKSLEEWWRDQRHEFLHGISGPVVMAHHLDDVAEWWVFSALNGSTRLIPYRKGNIIRPFLKVPKTTLVQWATKRNVPWVMDPSNKNTRYRRNLIRARIMPWAHEVNPGLYKVLIKKIEFAYKELMASHARPVC